MKRLHMLAAYKRLRTYYWAQGGHPDTRLFTHPWQLRTKVQARMEVLASTYRLDGLRGMR